VEKLFTRVWKWKNETCWNYSRQEWGEGEIKENGGGGEFNYDIL
jgi:hypothetical protein